MVTSRFYKTKIQKFEKRQTSHQCLFFRFWDLRMKKLLVKCWCQFHQCYTRKFFIRTLFQQLFSSYVYIVKAARTTFVQKICTFNVDEIDYWWKTNLRTYCVNAPLKMCFEVNDSYQTFVWWLVVEWMCHKGWWICNTQIIINTSLHWITLSHLLYPFIQISQGWLAK